MGHRISWDNEDQTVVLQEYTDPATKDDLYHLAQKSAQMLHTVQHTVHLIVDERNIHFPFTPGDLVYLAEQEPENEGAAMVIVPPSKVAFKIAYQKLSERISRKSFVNTYYVGSLEEARQVLQDRFHVRYPAPTPPEKPRLENTQNTSPAT